LVFLWESERCEYWRILRIIDRNLEHTLPRCCNLQNSTTSGAVLNNNIARFALPSLLGVLIFLTPIPWEGHLTIGIGIITGWVRALMGDYGLHFVVSLAVITSLLTLLGTYLRPAWIQEHRNLKDLFNVPLVWVLLRLAGTSFALIYFFQFGPALLQSEDVGGAVFVGIAVNVAAVYISACILLPLLTDFGLMEFAGTMARPLFRKVFQLPGRAAIDAVASFVGASAIGLLITIGQHDRGNYTGREASVIATNFSIVSIPFSLVVATVAGIEHLFIPWYGFIVLACLIAAFITPRLPPLSRKEDTYIASATIIETQRDSTHQSLMRESLHAAMQRAEESPGLRGFFAAGLKNLAFFLFSVITAAMALATVATLMVFHTPVFEWLGYPFIVILEWAQLPDAAAAATALFAGFLDQYMPALAASGVDSEVTSFVLAGLSVAQLIFMSETGVIILRSSLPITFADLVLIFLLRTAIVLPVLIVGAHLVAG
jgi:nucleoside recognition membrane protein YjiH